jgi:hypothetical protein
MKYLNLVLKYIFQLSPFLQKNFLPTESSLVVHLLLVYFLKTIFIIQVCIIGHSYKINSCTTHAFCICVLLQSFSDVPYHCTIKDLCNVKKFFALFCGWIMHNKCICDVFHHEFCHKGLKYTSCDSNIVTYVAFWTRIFKCIEIIPAINTLLKMGAVALLLEHADKKSVYQICHEFPSCLITQQCNWMWVRLPHACFV